MRKTLSKIGLALGAAAVLALSGPALADDTNTVSAETSSAMEAATRAPHKVANKFHARLGGETAEVARVEMTDDAATGPGRPRFKSGNRYHGVD